MTKGVVPQIFEGGQPYLEAVEELEKICKSWERDEWNELDWSRIKELQLREILEQRKQKALLSQGCQCLLCPQFLKHVSYECLISNFLLI